MRGSMRIATLAGIGVYVHWTFALLILWVLYIYGGGGPIVIVEGIAFVLAIFACVVLHELGHALAARRFGVGTRDITLLPIGGVARLQRMPEAPVEELVVAVAGPAVNVAIAGAIALVLLVTAGIPTIDMLTRIDGGFLGRLAAVNLFLVVFNLIPAFPMDGGRILRALLAMVLDYAVATRVAAAIAQLCAVGFVILGLFLNFNPFLIVIGLFVFFGARQEARAAETRALLRGITVRDAMTVAPRTIPPDIPITDAAREVLAGGQPDFPVATDDGSPGVVLGDDLLAAARAGAGHRPVADIMRTDVPRLDEGVPISGALEQMGAVRAAAALVEHGGHIIGVLTTRGIMDAVRHRGRRGRRGARAAAGRPSG